MNPSAESPPNMHLPEPMPVSPEHAPGQVADVPQAPMSEQMPSVTQTTRPSATSPFPPAPAAPIPADDDLVATDGDRIEKEWVNKAKQIILSTLDDPYQQNRQMAVFKADYIQKRYNKIIKLSE